jgi:hypothetical protein
MNGDGRGDVGRTASAGPFSRKQRGGESVRESERVSDGAEWKGERPGERLGVDLIPLTCSLAPWRAAAVRARAGARGSDTEGGAGGTGRWAGPAGPQRATGKVFPLLFFLLQCSEEKEMPGPPNPLQKCVSWPINDVEIFLITKNWLGQIWITFELFKNEKAFNVLFWHCLNALAH